MNFSFFAQSECYFHHHLYFQGLEQFLMLKASYLRIWLKCFYSNLKIIERGNLYIEVNKKIKITHSNWLTLTNLKYQLQNLSLSPKKLNYDCEMTLSSMIKLEMHNQNDKNVCSLNINILHTLSPLASNFAQSLHEDIFMIRPWKIIYWLIYFIT